MPERAQIPSLIEMVESLISTPSVSSTLAQFDQSNLPVIHTLANWLDPLGFDIDIINVPDKPGKANLIAKRGRGDGAFVLSGHSDTVPFDEDLWQTNPFSLCEKEDRWYGLGSCDMKSFFALAIEALRPLLENDFSHPLIILATADEESSMSGARALSAAELNNARFALIGEPTSLKPVNQHKGIMMLQAKVTGKSGHSSNPDLGNNALDGCALLIEELIKYRQELRDRFSNAQFSVSYPTLNLGCIHGGDNPNRICDHVELAFDLRVLPGMDNDEILDDLRHRLTPRLGNFDLGCELELLHPPVPSFQNGKHELEASIARLMDDQAGPVAFATEAPFLEALGMDTIVLGPGSIDQAHQPNEYLPLNQVDPAVDLIRSLLIQYCCED